MIAHYLEGDDFYRRKGVCTTGDQGHYEGVVLPLPEDYRLSFARRTEMPKAAELLDRHLKHLPAPVFLFAETATRLHILSCIEILRHNKHTLISNATVALDYCKDNTPPPRNQELSAKKIGHP